MSFVYEHKQEFLNPLVLGKFIPEGIFNLAVGDYYSILSYLSFAQPEWLKILANTGFKMDVNKEQKDTMSDTIKFCKPITHQTYVAMAGMFLPSELVMNIFKYVETKQMFDFRVLSSSINSCILKVFLEFTPLNLNVSKNYFQFGPFYKYVFLCMANLSRYSIGHQIHRLLFHVNAFKYNCLIVEPDYLIQSWTSFYDLFIQFAYPIRFHVNYLCPPHECTFFHLWKPFVYSCALDFTPPTEKTQIQNWMNQFSNLKHIVYSKIFISHDHCTLISIIDEECFYQQFGMVNAISPPFIRWVKEFKKLRQINFHLTKVPKNFSQSQIQSLRNQLSVNNPLFKKIKLVFM